MAEPNPQSNETTVIGPDSYFKGELSFESTAKIVGRFDGTIEGKGELQVAPDAQCKADVNAGSVQVDGTVEGNLTIKETVKLNAQGVVRGDITAGRMVMSEGATFFGHCAVGPDAASNQRKGGTPGGSSGSGKPSGGAFGSAGGDKSGGAGDEGKGPGPAPEGDESEAKK